MGDELAENQHALHPIAWMAIMNDFIVRRLLVYIINKKKQD
jgi:hypothetical protein